MPLVTIIMISVFVCLFVLLPVRLIVQARKQSKHSFICGSCGKVFRPKWTQLYLTFHLNEEYIIKCPFCGIYDFCSDKGEDYQN